MGVIRSVLGEAGGGSKWGALQQDEEKGALCAGASAARQVWVLWQLPAPGPNIVKSSKDSVLTPVSKRLP